MKEHANARAALHPVTLALRTLRERIGNTTRKNATFGGVSSSDLFAGVLSRLGQACVPAHGESTRRLGRLGVQVVHVLPHHPGVVLPPVPAGTPSP